MSDAVSDAGPDAGSDAWYPIIWIDRRSDNVTAEEGDRRTWELAGQLVQIDSSDPGAYEGQIEQWIYEWFTKEIEEKAGRLRTKLNWSKEK